MCLEKYFFLFGIHSTSTNLTNSSNHKQPNNKQNESFISTQLKAIREKSCQEKRKLEREQERERERERANKKAKANEIEPEKSKHQTKSTFNNQKVHNNDQRSKERENERAQANERERERAHEKEQANERDKTSQEYEIIMKEYDVEFYMKRGLTKNEAIEYIMNKLTVKKLWSKMIQKH